MRVTYYLSIPYDNGEIVGAELVVENGFVPPSKDYRLMIGPENSFAINDAPDSLSFDLEGNVFVDLLPDEYIDPQGQITAESYCDLIEDIKELSKKQRWKIVYRQEFINEAEIIPKTKLN